MRSAGIARGLRLRRELVVVVVVVAVAVEWRD